MPIMDRHEMGMFCWTDLATTEVDKAKIFYHEIFGWEFRDIPMGEDSFYTMLTLKGKDAAAMSQMQPEQAQQGVPPYWTCYFAVEEVDAVAQRASQLGGKVILGPMDVFAEWLY